ncbi:MAG TPA: S1C family serine protease [Lacipirellulaceae bacterium]|nr:S1C family serine protease [Lacipirellulaceae bacterium]
MTLPRWVSRAFAAVALLSSAAGVPPSVGQTTTSPVSLEPPAETKTALAARAPADVKALRLIEDQLQRVLARALPATVSVEIGRAAGSGVIVSPDGLVLTAAHVIGRPGRRAWVELPDGRRLRGTTLGADHEVDAGMVRLDEPPSNLPFAPVAEGTPITAGEWVVTTGQPGGLVEGRAPPVRLGRVLFFDDDMLCTDCKLVGGDSGGPLFDMRGQVVGIHSSIGPALTHNFHVPITAFRRDWQRLLASEVWGGRYDEENRRRAVLGVSGNSAADRCTISAVTDGMAAAKAGVRVGDVVAAVNGRAITTFDQLKGIVASKRPGDRVTLRIERAGSTLELVAQLTRPDGSLPPERRPPPDD